MPRGSKDNRGKRPTPEVEFWRQQDWESDGHYHKFATYRDLGPARRLRAAAALFYDRVDTGPTPGQYKHFNELSYLNMWTARCEAYDAEEELRRSHQMQQHRWEMLENHHRLGRMGENAAAAKLVSWLRDPESIPNSQVVHLLSVATTLSRLTLGEPSQRLETTGESEERQPDYSRLTDEEIDFLDNIGQKLYGATS